MSHPVDPTSPAPHRARRRPLLILAVLLWAVALLVPVLLGGGRLQNTLAHRAENTDPIVEVFLAEDPTLKWTGIARGTVTLNYELRLTGAPEAEVTTTGGTGTAAAPAIRGKAAAVRLREGEPHRGTITVPVVCKDRVKVGVHATGPVVGDAEVFTWVEPTKDTEGNIACTLI